MFFKAGICWEIFSLTSLLPTAPFVPYKMVRLYVCTIMPDSNCACAASSSHKQQSNQRPFSQSPNIMGIDKRRIIHYSIVVSARLQLPVIILNPFR